MSRLRSSLSPGDYSDREAELEGFFSDDGTEDIDPAPAEEEPASDSPRRPDNAEVARRGGAAGWAVADEALEVTD